MGKKKKKAVQYRPIEQPTALVEEPVKNDEPKVVVVEESGFWSRAWTRTKSKAHAVGEKIEETKQKVVTDFKEHPFKMVGKAVATIGVVAGTLALAGMGKKGDEDNSSSEEGDFHSDNEDYVATGSYESDGADGDGA